MPVPFFINLRHYITVIDVPLGNVAEVGALDHGNGNDQIPAICALQEFPVLINGL
jgi:hypothetical protein